MIILGIDPGTKITGYGIIKFEGTAFCAIDYGCIKPPANLKLSERYLIIYNSLEHCWSSITLMLWSWKRNMSIRTCRVQSN